MLELPTPTDDGLPIMSVGGWSRDKHHFLRRYIDAFTTAMRQKPWSALNYIDLFAGSGMLRLEGSGELEWGSPVIAALTDRFDNIYTCELEDDSYRALVARLGRVDGRAEVTCLAGDANAVVHDVVDRIPQRSLSIAFLDPHGLHLHFATLQTLAARRVDFIIFFPDHLDALRNCNYVYRDQACSNLDKVLGSPADWRTLLDETPKQNWAEALRKLYVDQIRTLGYGHFAFERISNRRGPLYLLIFCSRSEIGLKLWRHTSRTKPDGQRMFGFD